MALHSHVSLKENTMKKESLEFIFLNVDRKNAATFLCASFHREVICKEEKEHILLINEVSCVFLTAVIWHILNNSLHDKQ